MKHSTLVVVLLLIFIVACKQNNKTGDLNSKNTTVQSEQNSANPSTTASVNDSKESSSMSQIYELKNDGLYVYSDGPAVIEKNGDRGTKVVKNNYRYNFVPSERDKIKFKEGPRKYQNCVVEKTAQHDKGKPSLKELGYERHNEREIKPEDNRFGVNVTKDQKYHVTERVISETVDYNVIPKSAFTQLSIKEFVENGIVIIGKHISRVVIKSLVKLPKFADEVAVSAFIKKYNCSQNAIDSFYILPEVIADLKKINFKENIHEFVKDEPIPASRAYLSENEFTSLINNIHQLIPRIYDQTIHNVARYVEGYYLIEYYNGDILYDYHCIQLTKAACEPRLWDPLKTEAPKPLINEPGKDIHRLIVAEFNSVKDAEAFIYNNQVYDVLIYRRENGRVFIGKTFNTKSEAESELVRYANRGIKKESMKIERL